MQGMEDKGGENEMTEKRKEKQRISKNQPVYGWFAGRCSRCRRDNQMDIKLGDGQDLCESCWDEEYGKKGGKNEE